MRLNELKCNSDNINLDEYIEFRKQVKDNMEHPDWLGDFSKEDWIYYDADEPVCSMMLIPCDENALNSFDLSIKIKYRDVDDYGPMLVNPKYIGNQLQYQMLKELDEYSLKLGYKYAICTVHPDNKYSIKNLLLDGFELKRNKEFKRGVRNIYLKYIANE